MPRTKNLRQYLQLLLVLALLLVYQQQPAWAQGILDLRQVWAYKIDDTTTHPGFVTRLDNGNTLVASNSFNNPGITEVDNGGDLIWSYPDIQATSAVRLANGNTLITESGAPGPPLMPRVLEVTPDRQLVWSFDLFTRADAPVYAERLSNGNTLIVLPNRLLEVTPDKQTAWEYRPPEVRLAESRLVIAHRLNNGNTIYGIQGAGGRVVEITPAGDIVWQYGNGLSGTAPGQLVTVADIRRLENGNTLITDQGSARQLELDLSGRVVRATGWEEVLEAAYVSNSWYAGALTNGNIVLSYTKSSLRSTVLEINNKSIQVYIDGAWLYPEVSPRVEAGRTLLPLRAIFEGLKASVTWDPLTQTVTARKDERELKLKLGSSVAVINGQTFKLDVPPKLRQGRILVPLRFVSEALQAKVIWDQATRVVNITAAPAAPVQIPVQVPDPVANPVPNPVAIPVPDPVAN